MRAAEIGKKVLIVLVLAANIVLGFFAGVFFRGLSIAVFNVGADILSFTAMTIVPGVLFGLIYYADRKHRHPNAWSFMIGFIVGFGLISLIEAISL
jgi:hypothetical protein